MERPFSRSGLIALCVCTSLLAVAAPAAGAGGIVERDVSGPAGHHFSGFWTPQRIRSAPPLPLPMRVGNGELSGDPAAGGGAAGVGGLEASRTRAPQPPSRASRGAIKPDGPPPPFTSAPIPAGEVTSFPERANGRLIGRFKGLGSYSCSATVVETASDSVILTAAHCVYERRHGFATHLRFVPAYASGTRPFGAWNGRNTVINRQWFKSENLNYDYAAVRLDRSHGPIGDVVGELGLAWGQPRKQKYKAIGYPSNLGGTELMWGCKAPFAGTDFDDRAPGRPASGIGCDMRNGASGGGWTIAGGSGDRYLNSVTSFGYKKLEKVIFGPYLTKKVLKVVHAASKG
jgi:hypothetical protein